MSLKHGAWPLFVCTLALQRNVGGSREHLAAIVYVVHVRTARSLRPGGWRGRQGAVSCPRLPGLPIALSRSLAAASCYLVSLPGSVRSTCTGKTKPNRGGRKEQQKEGGGTLERIGTNHHSPSILARKPPYTTAKFTSQHLQFPSLGVGILCHGGTWDAALILYRLRYLTYTRIAAHHPQSHLYTPSLLSHASHLTLRVHGLLHSYPSRIFFLHITSLPPAQPRLTPDVCSGFLS
ncbi:hypothetical protein LZ30DRAFT_266582 [Colletotrichum cereale]|nr:hypothetical protein LZ30DRAFT_266582 [Colletotrichum cereale]